MNIQNTLQKLHETMTDGEIGQAINAPSQTVNRLRHGVHKTTFYERAKAIERLAVSKGIKID